MEPAAASIPLIVGLVIAVGILLILLVQSNKRLKNIYGVLGDFTTLIASTSVVTPKVIFSSGGWSIEQLGTEIQFKYNDTIKQRFLSDGSIIATGDVIEFG